ncbi:MAG: branched-chain amino acid ABC transporter permease [Deltaproteobacteria bacterium]|nr:branched-chain amino acid ABC transporter permease [Deltaproteobacteria bacterium]
MGQNNLLTGVARFGWWIFLIIAFLLIPAFSNKYAMTLINNTLITALAVIGLNVIAGYAGVMSLGNAAFMGIGAYSAAILASQAGIPWWLALLIGALAAMLIGTLIGIPALRLRGIYLLMATLALHMITAFAMNHYETATKRLAGIRFPKPSVGIFVFDSSDKFYYLFLTLTALVVLFVYNLMRTGMGRSLLALRDNESAARAMGVNITFAKLMAFAVSSFIVGLAGGLQGVYLRNVTGEMYGFGVAMDQIVALFIGGNGLLFGPVFGAAFISLLPETIDLLAHSIQGVLPIVGQFLSKFRFEIQLFVYGFCIILVLLRKPTGLAGIFGDISLFLKKRILNQAASGSIKRSVEKG